jgi:hypothetical protein
MEMFMLGFPAAESIQRNTCGDSQNSNGEDKSSHMVSFSRETNPGILQSTFAQHRSCSSVPNSLFLGGPALVASKSQSKQQDDKDLQQQQPQLLPNVSGSLGWVTWNESCPTHTF